MALRGLDRHLRCEYRCELPGSRDGLCAVHYRRFHHGMKYKPPRSLTVLQVRQIRAAYTAGEKQETLAKKFGVSQPSISRIVRSG